MATFSYPPSPAFVPAEKLNPSADFRKQAVKVVISIILFFAVYLLLIIAAIILAIALCYLGIQLIIAMPRVITLIAGLGMFGVGVSVIYFLFKFLFAVSKNENPDRIEVTEKDQPELFAFIRKLSEETKASFPKKIFISPDVNACVFYNSSFWSMLLPVRKNLEIGLGLVNSINISELKAVIAHEFGHFSQRSMKLGSFTYNVNKVIYNMLYENNSYNSFLNAWGSLHGVLSFFAQVAVKIATGIKYILKEMYQLINKSYMGLSREMEFHADAVAASTAGGNNVISGLSRIELAGSCYNTAMNKARSLLKDKKIITNFFDSQLAVLQSVASKLKLPVKNNLPKVSYEFMQSFSASRVNFKNQWASHPELKERKQHLEILDLNVEPDETPAWVVFSNKEHLQKLLTKKLYSGVEQAEQMDKLDSSEFNKLYEAETNYYRLPSFYKGYYDGRYFETKDWDFDNLSVAESNETFDYIFSDEHVQLQPHINNNLADIEILKVIKENRPDIKTFDFDGVKYDKKDCNTIIQQLEKEAEEKMALLNQSDKDAFRFFLKCDPAIRSHYELFTIVEQKFNTFTNVVNHYSMHWILYTKADCLLNVSTS